MPIAPNTRATCANSVGLPTRIAPCRSAVTRSMLPNRSAVSGLAATKSRFTSCDTSTSVVYAGTSVPYKSESAFAKRARNCHCGVSAMVISNLGLADARDVPRRNGGVELAGVTALLAWPVTGLLHPAERDVKFRHCRRRVDRGEAGLDLVGEPGDGRL